MNGTSETAATTVAAASFQSALLDKFFAVEVNLESISSIAFAFIKYNKSFFEVSDALVPIVPKLLSEPAVAK